MKQLILIRHGQYDAETGALTALGRRQAAATARALRRYEIDAIHCSTMLRAQETAAILKKSLGLRLPVRASALLRERFPTPVPELTTRADLPEIRQNLAIMKRAYARLTRPARGDRTELVVAHGNLIRLFVCLALEAKPTSWLKMRINNCSLSVLIVKANWGEGLASFNDVGHLPSKLRTVT